MEEVGRRWTWPRSVLLRTVLGAGPVEKAISNHPHPNLMLKGLTQPWLIERR